MTSIEVLAAGPLTTIQDLGRPGLAHLGVPRSGAADRASLIRANRLAGNPDGAPALETTLSGPRLRIDGGVTVALTGAPVQARADGRAVPMNEPFQLEAGQELRIGTARSGLRTYIAFTGGIAAPLVLGSASTDVLTGLGPPPLARGDRLLLTGVRASYAPAPELPPELHLAASPALRVVVGPRSDWFAADSITRLTQTTFVVNHASNRVGLRLDGCPFERAREGELPSEGLVPGAIQVPPDGRPILLLADHPTTGGYPVLAVVRAADLRLAAQLRPGQELRFSAERGSDQRA